MIGVSWQAQPGLFFEPVQLDFEPPDFAVQQFGRAVLGHRSHLGAAFAFKQGFGLHLDFGLPLPHLHRVHFVLLGQLVDRLNRVSTSVSE